MTLSRATLHGRSVVIVSYELGDGRLCGFARRLHQRPRTFAGILKHTGRGLARVVFGGFLFAGIRRCVQVLPRLPRAGERPVHVTPPNFIGALKAPRRLFHFNSTLKLRQKSARCFTNALSLLVAPAFHEQDQTMGQIPNERKSEARSGNFTARDGNYAC